MESHIFHANIFGRYSYSVALRDGRLYRFNEDEDEDEELSDEDDFDSSTFNQRDELFYDPCPECGYEDCNCK